MSDLTEHEVIDRLKTSLREAGQACLDLAGVGKERSTAYDRLRESLMLGEGCCRQLSVFRADWRWTELGQQLFQSKEHARKWLDGFHKIDGATGETIKVTYEAKRKAQLFDKLAKNLAFFLVGVEEMMNRKTGVIGKPLLPEVPAAERRVGAPVQVMLPAEFRTKGGILLPKGAI